MYQNKISSLVLFSQYHTCIKSHSGVVQVKTEEKQNNKNTKLNSSLYPQPPPEKC